MRYLITTLFITIVAIPVFAGVTLDGTSQEKISRTTKVIGDQSNATIVIDVDANSVTSGYVLNIWSTFSGLLSEEISVSFSSGSLRVRQEASCLIGSCESKVNTYSGLSAESMRICIQDNFDSETSIPTVYVNGSELSNTSHTDGNSSGTWDSDDYMTFGDSLDLNDPIDGQLTGVAIYGSQVGNDVCELITTDATKTVIHEFSPVQYWRFDEQPLGGITATTTYYSSVQDSTVNVEWYDNATSTAEFYLQN